MMVAYAYEYQAPWFWDTLYVACLSSSQAKFFGGARGNGPTVYEAILLAVFLIFLGPWISHTNP